MSERTKGVPRHIQDIAAKLHADENGPQWDALAEWKVAPDDVMTLTMFETILLRAAELHQQERANAR